MRADPPLEEEYHTHCHLRLTCPLISLQGKEEQPEPTATGTCQSNGKPCSCPNANFDSLLNRWLFHPTPTGEAAPPRLQIKIREIQSEPQLWINRCDFPLSVLHKITSPPVIHLSMTLHLHQRYATVRLMSHSALWPGITDNHTINPFGANGLFWSYHSSVVTNALQRACVKPVTIISVGNNSNSRL